MPLKPEDYRHHFDGFDLSEDQKAAMCEAVCAVAQAFADLAFGVHPSQQIGIANDSNSMSDSSMVTFFEEAATDPILDEFADLLAGQEDGEQAATKRS